MTASDGSIEIKYVKSSASGGPDGSCVEAGWDPQRGLVAVRHSMRTTEPPLLFNTAEWEAFLLGVKAGEFEAERLANRA